MTGVMKMANGHIEQQMDEYFALPTGKARKDYLDKKIDQLDEVRKMMGDPENPHPTAPTTQPGEKRRFVFKSKDGPAGAKAMHEMLPAEVQARLAEYQRDMAARRAERELPPDNGAVFVRFQTGQK